MVAEPTIAHSILEYGILLLFGGGGILKGRDLWRSRNGMDARTMRLKQHIFEAHKPLLKELKDLCEITAL